MGLAVGIDLGTSYSVVAAVIDGKPTVLADADGRRTQPSVVAFGFDGTPVVGWKAQRQLMYAPESTVTSPKRLMGCRFCSPEVQQLAQNVGYGLVESASGEVLARVREREYTVPQLSGLILEHMKKVAETATGQVVDRAVITVPAYFNDRQRLATREAAKLAGLECLRIINEPTAAALAYGAGLSLSENLAVYDLGGGTFDISVLRLSQDVYEVVGTAGDTFLGGDDFDAAVARHILNQVRTSRRDLAVRDNRVSWLRLLSAAERAKVALNEHDVVEMAVPGVARTHEGKDAVLEASLDRLTFTRLVMPLVQRTFQVCDESLKLAALSVGQIDKVLMVGGMSRLFLIQEAVEHYFGKAPTLDVDPHEVVSLGAAMQAATLAGVDGPSQNAILLDVTSRSLGVATKGGFVETIIPRNSPIPTQASKFFRTTVDNQTMVRVSVYQGESKKVTMNDRLGEFVLDQLRPAPRGETRVSITFEIDADGIVHVIAEEPETGVRRTLMLNIEPVSAAAD